MGRFLRMGLLLLLCVPLLSACAPLHHPEPYHHHYYVGLKPDMAPPPRPHFNGRPPVPAARPLPPPSYGGHWYSPVGSQGPHGRPAMPQFSRTVPRDGW